MKKIKLLMILGVSIILIFISYKSYAVDYEISVLDYNQEQYIIYMQELLDKSFKYAISTEENIQEKNLNYITSKKDSEGNSLIILDKKEYQSFKGKDIYLWIKQDGKIIVNEKKIDFNNIISRDDMINLEHLTKLIPVKTDGKVEVKTIEDSIEKTKTLGCIEFENKNNKYYYQLININVNKELQNLFDLSSKLKQEYLDMNIIEKIETLENIQIIYKNLIKNANLKEVENFKIIEPEYIKDDEKYVLLIQELGEVENFDIQLLNTTRKYEEKYKIEEIQNNITNNTTDNITNNIDQNIIIKNENTNNFQNIPNTLPVTYDSKILIVIISIIFATIVGIWIRCKNLEKKDINEK